MNPAVFVDRDNTLIHNDGDLGDPNQVRLIQGAASAIASLCGLGYRVIVVTNQGGVARGKFREADVEAVHQRIRELVIAAANGAHIERFYYCPFHPEGTIDKYTQEHPHRKPAPGMVQQAAKDLDLDLSQSWMVGDQMRDIQAGAAAGVRTVLVRPDADQLTRRQFSEPAATVDEHGQPRAEVTPDFLARGMVEAVRIIAQQRKPDSGEDRRRSPLFARRVETPPPSRQQNAQTPVKTSATRPRRPEPTEATEPQNIAGPSWAGSPGSPGPSGATSTEPRSVSERTAAKEAKNVKEPLAAALPEADGAVVTGAETGAGAGDSPARLSESEDSDTQPATETTVRLMLQELRNQRGAENEFSYLIVVAIVLQMVAAVCLLGALVMGAHSGYLFVRWLGAGLMVQLATIALLLFARR